MAFVRFGSLASLSGRGLVAMVVACLFWPQAVQAQCGYGTPEFDCRQQQQQAEAARQNDEAARRAQEEAVNSQPPPAQMRAIDSYMAAAWHKQSSDAWISTGYLSPDRARRAALDACNRAMGGGCTIASENVNGTIAIARGLGGDIYAATNGSRGKTERQVLDFCRKQKDECAIINTVWARPGYAPIDQRVSENGKVYGPRQNFRRSFGAVVGLNGSNMSAGTWHGGVWVASGFGSEEQAREKALEACRKDSPRGCEVWVALPDVFVAFAASAQNQTYYASGPTPEIAERRAAELCKKDKVKCRKGGWVNLAYRGDFRFDPQAEGMPWHTAQAWVKGSPDPWRTSVWSVAGVKDQEGAKRAALAACKKETKKECEVATWSFNSRVLLYSEPSGLYHIAWIHREVDPARFVQTACAEQKITCKLVKVIDARVPGTERIEVR